MRNTHFTGLLVFLLITTLEGLSQVTPAYDFDGTFDTRINVAAQVPSSRRTIACTDTAGYPFWKASLSDLQGLNINIANSADKVGQYFDGPQNMSIAGFTFYAWQNDGTADEVLLNCKIYLADTDSLPTGAPLATTTVKVDSNFYGGSSLALLEKKAIFPAPVNVSFPFVLTVENSTVINVAVVTSSWDSTDGRAEWLSMAHLQGVWRHGYETFVNMGTTVFDADFLFFPHISYNINTAFSTDTNCIVNGGTVNFTNTSTGNIINSRYYNKYVFLGIDSLRFAWNYGDGTPVEYKFENGHTFAAGNNYDVWLTSNVVGFTNTCTETYTKTINPLTVADFSYTTNGLTIDFTSESERANSTTWDFGDGMQGTGTAVNHSYNSTGIYDVTLSVSGECGNDTMQKQIAICNMLTNGFNYSQIIGSISFTATAQNYDDLLWNFGDDDTSMVANPMHNYPNPGDYTVCLIASNACASDTTCQNITVPDTSTGILTVTAGNIRLYPNPSTGRLILHLDGWNPNEVNVTVYNAVGEKILSAYDVKSKEFAIDLAPHHEGLYYVKVFNKQFSFVDQIALIR